MADSGTGGTPGGVCNLACVMGKHCELVPVQCVKAPCPAQPQCVDDSPAQSTCGGIANLPCPDMQECVDDPSDTCDPQQGGADCSGICQPISAVCNLACAKGKHCELVQVTCVRAPCPPLAQCVDDATAPGPQCGGIAGLPCPGMAECVDDPTDGCDPQTGGADCGGLCVCNKGVLCAKGMMWNGAPSVCACVPAAGDGAGPACGKTTCPAGQQCCNASCGTCTPPGYACTQQACL